MAVEMEQCRGGGILANSSHGSQVSPASVVGVATAAQLKMQKLACSGGASPCPQSVSPLLPPTPPGSRSPPSSRLSPSPHQQQNNTQPQLQQQQQHEPRPQQQQQRILPFSIDNILKPDFGNSKSDYGRLHSSRSPEPPELLLRTPPKTPEVPSRHDSPVDLSHKANSIINNGISAGLGLNGGNKTNNEILLSHSINLLIGPHSHPLHPLQHHLQQTLLQQQHQQIQHVSQPHLQHPIITKPIPLSTSTAFQIFKPLSNFAEQQRRLQQQHHLEQQQHHLQQQQLQHQLRITSPHLKPPVPHQDHLNSNTQSQQSVNKHKVIHQHQKEQHQQPFKEQPQQSPIQHQTILHQNTKTPLPAPSPTPSTCSTTSSCSSTTSTTGSTKNNSLSPNNSSSSSSSSKSGNSKPSSDSLEELVNPKIPEDNSNWPAWVYCTRYSDRPSSGPRSRRVKRHDRNPEEKRPRTAFTSDQLNRLKKEFEDNKYLTEKRRQDLARELGLNESQIKIWFQNKRAKIKKNSGPRSGLAQHLMAQGLYNHCTVPVDEDDPYLS